VEKPDLSIEHKCLINKDVKSFDVAEAVEFTSTVLAFCCYNRLTWLAAIRRQLSLQQAMFTLVMHHDLFS